MSEHCQSWKRNPSIFKATLHGEMQFHKSILVCYNNPESDWQRICISHLNQFCYETKTFIQRQVVFPEPERFMTISIYISSDSHCQLLLTMQSHGGDLHHSFQWFFTLSISQVQLTFSPFKKVMRDSSAFLLSAKSSVTSAVWLWV